MMTEKTAQSLWQDYRFLTREMKKFLSVRKMELFYELMNQRERLQGMIAQTPDKGFKASVEGKRLLTEIQHDNEYIRDELQRRINKSKRSHYVAEVYTATDTGQVSRRNWNG